MVNFFLGIIAGAIIVLAFHYQMRDECPRMIRGYHCKGPECDHSPAAIAEAKWDMHRQ